MSAALLWDLDGTLIDSSPDLAAAGNRARAAIGLEALDLATVRSYVGDGLRALLDRLCGNVTPEQRALAERAFRTWYADHLTDATVVYPQVRETLAELHQRGWRMAVVTNKPDGWSQTIVAQLDLASWLPVVIGGDGVRKPAADPLERALVALGVSALGSWMIGDHHTDLRAATAAGLRSVWCPWGIGHQDGEAPDASVASPKDILDVVGFPSP